MEEPALNPNCSGLLDRKAANFIYTDQVLQNLAKGGSKSNWSIVLAASDVLIFLRQGDENTISKTLGYITMTKKGCEEHCKRIGKGRGSHNHMF